MPQVSSELNAQYYEPVATGPVAQCDISAWAGLNPPPPASIAASGNWTSGIIVADGYKAIAVGVLSSQAGAISIQRYLDRAGNVPQGPAISATITAAAAQVCNANDGAPFQSFKITITNTGTVAATLSNFACLLNAA
jgi:hypothetical protein